MSLFKTQTLPQMLVLAIPILSACASNPPVVESATTQPVETTTATTAPTHTPLPSQAPTTIPTNTPTPTLTASPTQTPPFGIGETIPISLNENYAGIVFWHNSLNCEQVKSAGWAHAYAVKLTYEKSSTDVVLRTKGEERYFFQEINEANGTIHKAYYWAVAINSTDVNGDLKQVRAIKCDDNQIYWKSNIAPESTPHATSPYLLETKNESFVTLIPHSGATITCNQAIANGYSGPTDGLTLYFAVNNYRVNAWWRGSDPFSHALTPDLTQVLYEWLNQVDVIGSSTTTNLIICPEGVYRH